MKVLFVTTESTMDHSFTMINELRKFIDLDVVITSKKLTPELDNYCKVLDVKFFKRRSFKNPLSIFNEIKLLLYVRRQKPDLVWFNVLSLYQSLLVKLFLKNVLVNAHDIELHTADKDLHGRLSQKLTFRLYKKSMAVMSSTQAKQFEGKYGKKPYVLQLPIIDYYTHVSSVKPGFKNTIQTDENILKFFFFGSIMPYKGIEKLLDAAGILEEKGISLKVNIFGRLRYDNEALLEKMKKLKSIYLTDKFIDYRDVCGIYDQNDVLIVPYEQVSQCGPLLIGFSRIVPVICSDLEGFREYVDEGKSGLFFDNTAESLAEKMELLISSPLTVKSMREYIKTEVNRKFSMQSLSSGYVKVFSLARSGGKEYLS